MGRTVLSERDVDGIDAPSIVGGAERRRWRGQEDTWTDTRQEHR
jgi:hypothetical protein